MIMIMITMMIAMMIDNDNDDEDFFSNFIPLLNTFIVTNTNLTKNATCIWLAYSD